MFIHYYIYFTCILLNVKKCYANNGRVSYSARGALKALFWATDGRNWQYTWDIQNIHSDPCLDHWYGISCDEDGNIISIHLAQNNLVGYIPEIFARPSIQSLHELDLSSNFLCGDIPPSLSLLKSIRILRLDRNKFIGKIPQCLGDLPQLEYLELQGNFFEVNDSGQTQLSKQARLQGTHLIA